MVHCTVLPAGTQGGEALRVMRIVWHRCTCIKNLQSSHRRCPIWEPATHSHNGERNESAGRSHFAGNCKKRKKPAGNGKLAARKLKTFWKQQEKVENSAEKLQNGAAGAGKRTPSRPTKKPNRLKMVGHLYKTHLENRSSTSLILCDATKKKAWRDSNPRHLASENYDAAHISMIYSNFLLVLHCYSTSITSSIKQCVNDKNWPLAVKNTAGGQLLVKKWSMRARYGAAFCLTVSPFHSGSRHNPLLSEFTDINAIYQFPIGHSFAQGNSDKKVI